MAVSRARLTAMPHTVRIAPRMAERASEVCTAVCAPSLSLAPRNWDTTTPAPTAMPWLNPMSRKMGEPLEPPAASALLPTKLPTMMLSAVLYSCCSMLPRISGTEKSRMLFQMLPSVISRDFFFSSKIVCAIMFPFSRKASTHISIVIQINDTLFLPKSQAKA